LFIEIFEREAKKLNNITFLAQGTLYPDVIESLQHQDGSSVAVKSHHNVGGLPEKMNMVLVEPLKQLFKDEVRLVGRALGLPAEVVDRHPFPGPGLGVRCIGAITPERLETLREVDAIFIKELRKENLYDQIWQALATLLPVKSVGLRDGRRNYQEVCTIRAITSVDAMSATTYPFTHQFLQHLSEKIVREVPLVSRVLYDITDKPPATIEWE
jgi:GMP synthase (glutamine-hydrolysing)